MVQYSDVDQAECFHELLGYGSIRFGWLAVPGGMVVRQNDRGGVPFQGLLYNDPWVNGGAVDGTEKQPFEAKYLMFVVHKQHREVLVLLVGQGHLQKPGGVLGGGKGLASSQALLQDGGGGVGREGDALAEPGLDEIQTLRRPRGAIRGAWRCPS